MNLAITADGPRLHKDWFYATVNYFQNTWYADRFKDKQEETVVIISYIKRVK